MDDNPSETPRITAIAAAPCIPPTIVAYVSVKGKYPGLQHT
jgi:hypothetical protein